MLFQNLPYAFRKPPLYFSKTSLILFENLPYTFRKPPLTFRKPPLYFLKDKNVVIVSYYSHPTVTCFMIGFHQLDGIP